ncbi:MAG TPA: hypothetical protein PLB16_04055, partial [bacterium]|nr:hypothetical protein [bacterium]
SFSRLKGVDPNNPFVYYYYALYVLKDPSVLDLKIISKEPFIKNNWNCNAAKKNIVEALKLDKTGLLKIPKSYTEQCGEWMSPK